MNITRSPLTVTITLRRRPYWHWLLACLWLAGEIFIVQTALASAAEDEYRAATIAWVAAATLAVAAILPWSLSRYLNRPKSSGISR